MKKTYGQRVASVALVYAMVALPAAAQNSFGQAQQGGGFGQAQPGFGQAQPGFGQQPQPGYQGQQPGFGGQQPGFAGQQPGFGGQQPGYQGQQPGFAGQQPGFAGQQPGFQGQQPGFGGQQPGFAGQPQPGYQGQQPGFGGQQPGFAGQQPGVPGQQPGFAGQPHGGPSQQPQPGGGAPGQMDPQIVQFLEQLAQYELQDFGVPATQQLHSGPMHGATPTSIPGGRVITTRDIVFLVQGQQTPYMLFDVLGSGEVMPGAIAAVEASSAGQFGDQISQQMGQYLQQATRGNTQVPLIFYCLSRECWMSYNAALRAINLGYSQVYWYRGGLEAWKQAGGPTVPAGYGQQPGQAPQQPGQFQQPGGQQGWNNGG